MYTVNTKDSKRYGQFMLLHHVHRAKTFEYICRFDDEFSSRSERYAEKVVYWPMMNFETISFESRSDQVCHYFSDFQFAKSSYAMNRACVSVFEQIKPVTDGLTGFSKLQKLQKSIYQSKLENGLND